MNRELPEEFHLRLRVNGKQNITFLCTADSLRELVLGWLYNEGLIRCLSEVQSLEIGAGTAEVCLAKVCEDWAVMRSSGLGGFGLDTIEEPVPVSAEAAYALDEILDFAGQMDARCVRYRQTGGMHCSAVFDRRGLRYLFEDIGRHNTFDKAAGASLLNGDPLQGCLLITTGRISADMVKKAARMGICVIASYSVPTANAAELARKLGVRLIGYLRREDRQVFCGPEQN